MKLASKGGQEAAIEVNFAFDITASDTVNVTNVGALVHCKSSGNYNILLTGMTVPIIMYLVAGITYPFRILRLYITSTDDVNGLIGLTSVSTNVDVA